MNLIELLKVILFGIVEGITEWLPVSSTGHLILLGQFVQLDQPEAFFNVFKVVIQLGAIMAVVVTYWDRLWPFSRRNSKAKTYGIITLWIKIVIACIPAIVVGLPLDDIIDEHLSSPTVIAVMLILYGIIFIIFETKNRNTVFPVNSMKKLDYRTALLIGLFQCLALIPGTSRSGATILGAMALGCARPVAAEFSFFIGIPVIAGASLLKIIKYGPGMTLQQIIYLLTGMLVSFLVAIYPLKAFIRYIKRHDFRIFGYYRIIFGLIFLAVFTLKG